LNGYWTAPKPKLISRELARVVAKVWATVAFAKRIEGAGEILLMLNKELTEEEIDQSIQILPEINKKHPEMLGGVIAEASQAARADGVDGGLIAMVFTSSKCPHQDCKR